MRSGTKYRFWYQYRPAAVEQNFGSESKIYEISCEKNDNTSNVSGDSFYPATITY